MHAVGAQDKYQAMGHWLDRLDNSPEELQLPLSNISLKGDVERFWAILKDADNLLDMAETFRQEADVRRLFNADSGLANQFIEAQEELERLSFEEAYEMQMMRDAQRKLEAEIGNVEATKVKKEAS